MLYRLGASREAKIVKRSLKFICKITRANPWLTYALPCTKESTFNPERALGCYPTTELQKPPTSGVNPPETAKCLLKSAIRQWSLLHCISKLSSCHQMPLDYMTWHGIGSLVNHLSFIWHPTLVIQKLSSCPSMGWKNQCFQAPVLVIQFRHKDIHVPTLLQEILSSWKGQNTPLTQYAEHLLSFYQTEQFGTQSYHPYSTNAGQFPIQTLPVQFIHALLRHLDQQKSTQGHEGHLKGEKILDLLSLHWVTLWTYLMACSSGYVCRSKQGKILVRSILNFSKECIASKEIK